MRRVGIRQAIKYRISTASLLKRLSLQSIGLYYPGRLVRWAGHVLRMPVIRILRPLLTGSVVQSRLSGSALMTWGRTRRRALKKFDLPTDFKGWSAIATNRITRRAKPGYRGILPEPRPNTYREK